MTNRFFPLAPGAALVLLSCASPAPHDEATSSAQFASDRNHFIQFDQPARFVSEVDALMRSDGAS